MRSTSFQPVSLTLTNYRTYLLGAAFVLGNIVLPQLCHLIPEGGKIFLPIYFFTLIASYKFGIRIGLLTAVISPICNHLLFGMPPTAVLPILLIKSSLLAIIASAVAQYSKKVSLLLLLVTVVSYQLIGGVIEFIIADSFAAAVQDFTLGFPGMIIQIALGWYILKLLAKYEC
ncbi:MAG: ECF transporter S component [Bacteroidaceae bacterium]|nr:ECF transporter S component [Bacteroidaceae bacterium]